MKRASNWECCDEQGNESPAATRRDHADARRGSSHCRADEPRARRRDWGQAVDPAPRLFGPEDSAGIVSFAIEGVHPHDIGTILDDEGVAIRAGHHCAQPLMEWLGVPATARASFAAHSSSADIEALVDGLHKVRRIFG